MLIKYTLLFVAAAIILCSCSTKENGESIENTVDYITTESNVAEATYKSEPKVEAPQETTLPTPGITKNDTWYIDDRNGLTTTSLSSIDQNKYIASMMSELGILDISSNNYHLLVNPSRIWILGEWIIWEDFDSTEDIAEWLSAVSQDGRIRSELADHWSQQVDTDIILQTLSSRNSLTIRVASPELVEHIKDNNIEVTDLNCYDLEVTLIPAENTCYIQHNITNLLLYLPDYDAASKYPLMEFSDVGYNWVLEESFPINVWASLK